LLVIVPRRDGRYIDWIAFEFTDTYKTPPGTVNYVKSPLLTGFIPNYTDKNRDPGNRMPIIGVIPGGKRSIR